MALAVLGGFQPTRVGKRREHTGNMQKFRIRRGNPMGPAQGVR